MLEFEARGSLLESLDPRTKMLMVFLLSLCAVVAENWEPLVLTVGILLALGKLARMSVREHRLVLAMAFCCAVAGVATQSVFYGTLWVEEPRNILLELTPAGTPVLGELAVSREGIAHGGIVALRLVIIGFSALLIPLTTHPADLMLSLVRMKVPFQLVVVCSLGFRFIPLLERNLRHIMDAQRLRGIRPLSMRGLNTSFNALLVTTLRVADRLAIALETRAFRPTGERTFYRRLQPGRMDLVMICICGGVFIFALTFG